MLQMFSLNVVKVDLVLHMLQWDPSATVPVAAAGPVHIRVGVEGARAGYMRAQIETKRRGHGAAWAPT
jgi:hypothetical protein